MIPFLLSFFLIYGLMHGYAFLKARAALHFGSLAGILLGLFMLSMILAPLCIRVLEQRGFEDTAEALSWGAYLWLGFLFLLIVCALIFDVWRILGIAAA